MRGAVWGSHRTSEDLGLARSLQQPYGTGDLSVDELALTLLIRQVPLQHCRELRMTSHQSFCPSAYVINVIEVDCPGLLHGIDPFREQLVTA